MSLHISHKMRILTFISWHYLETCSGFPHPVVSLPHLDLHALKNMNVTFVLQWCASNHLCNLLTRPWLCHCTLDNMMHGEVVLTWVSCHRWVGTGGTTSLWHYNNTLHCKTYLHLSQQVHDIYVRIPFQDESKLRWSITIIILHKHAYTHNKLTISDESQTFRQVYIFLLYNYLNWYNYSNSQEMQDRLVL